MATTIASKSELIISYMLAKVKSISEQFFHGAIFSFMEVFDGIVVA